MTHQYLAVVGATAVAALLTGAVASTAAATRRTLDLERAEVLALVRNLLLGPGPTVHELSHALVAMRYADVDIAPGRVRSTVHIDWPAQAPIWGVVGTYMAPLLAGGLLLLLAAAHLDGLAALPLVVQVWLAVNMVLLAGPSLVDVVELGQLLGGQS